MEGIKLKSTAVKIWRHSQDFQAKIIKNKGHSKWSCFPAQRTQRDSTVSELQLMLFFLLQRWFDACDRSIDSIARCDCFADNLLWLAKSRKETNETSPWAARWQIFHKQTFPPRLSQPGRSSGQALIPTSLRPFTRFTPASEECLPKYRGTSWYETYLEEIREKTKVQ